MTLSSTIVSLQEFMRMNFSVLQRHCSAQWLHAAEHSQVNFGERYRKKDSPPAFLHDGGEQAPHPGAGHRGEGD